MSIELIGILTVGAALAAMNLATLRSVRTEVRIDIRGVRDELHGVRGELRSDIRAVDDRVRALDDRMRTQERSTAKLEGFWRVCARRWRYAGPWSGATAPARGHGGEQAQG